MAARLLLLLAIRFMFRTQRDASKETHSNPVLSFNNHNKRPESAGLCASERASTKTDSEEKRAVKERQVINSRLRF